MELLYVWIDEYKNISKQGFNFSDKFHFTYDHVKDTLDFEERPGLPKDFWGEDVMNLTLLLGKNGAGKSSVLDYLNQPDLKNGIFVFKQKQSENFTNKIELCVFYAKNLLKNRPNLDRNYFVDYKKLTHSNFQNYFEDIYKIFYTPLFRGDKPGIIDNEPFNITFDSAYDKSKGKRMSQFNQSSVDLSPDSELYQTLWYMQLPNTSSNPYYQYNVIQTIKQIWFLCDDRFNEIHKKVFSKKFPKLEISAKTTDFNLSPFKKEDKVKLNTFLNEIRAYINEINEDEVRFTSICLYGLILEFIQHAHFDDNKEKLIELLKLDINKIGIKGIYNFSITFLSYEHENRLLKIPSTLSKFSKKFKSNVQPDLNTIVINFGELAKLRNEELFDFSKSKATSVNLRWTDLSTGELFLLTLFGRFFNTSLVAKNKVPIHILIDEGETTLHPHWQKQYIKWITGYIPMMFPEKKIQFILASNNPIIASDVPSSNIVFLDVDKTTGKTTVREKPLETHNTFAANIHTLYRESFFMEDGVMGAFAIEKINACIDDLIKKEALSDARKVEIKSIISMVGEPVIKEKLTQLYHQKYRLDYDNDLEEIKKRLKRLEDGK